MADLLFRRQGHPFLPNLAEDLIGVGRRLNSLRILALAHGLSLVSIQHRLKPIVVGITVMSGIANDDMVKKDETHERSGPGEILR